MLLVPVCQLVEQLTTCHWLIHYAWRNTDDKYLKRKMLLYVIIVVDVIGVVAIQFCGVYFGAYSLYML